MGGGGGGATHHLHPATPRRPQLHTTHLPVNVTTGVASPARVADPGYRRAPSTLAMLNIPEDPAKVCRAATGLTGSRSLHAHPAHAHDLAPGPAPASTPAPGPPARALGSPLPAIINPAISCRSHDDALRPPLTSTAWPRLDPYSRSREERRGRWTGPGVGRVWLPGICNYPTSQSSSRHAHRRHPDPDPPAAPDSPLSPSTITTTHLHHSWSPVHLLSHRCSWEEHLPYFRRPGASLGGRVV